MNIVQILEEVAAAYPDRTAIVDWADGRRAISFNDLQNQVALCATRLYELGVARDSTVLFAVSVKIELYILMLACWRLGARVVFIDPTYSWLQILHCLKMACPDTVLVDTTSLFSQTLKLFGIKRCLAAGKVLATAMGRPSPGQAAQAIAPPGEHSALLTFTSGSTGLPKGIVRSHDFLIRQAEFLAEELAIGNYTSEMTTLPVFVLANLARAVTSLLPPGKLSHTADCLLASMPERILAAPAFLHELMNELDKRSLVLHFVREIRTGGGPVFPSLLGRLRRVFPQARIWTVYGSTEAEPIACLEISGQVGAKGAVGLRQVRRLAGSGAGLLVGNPVVDLLVVRPQALQHTLSMEQLRAAAAGPDEIGEILVAGSHVIGGYLNGLGDSENKVKTEEVIYHRTGDAGYLDSDGNLFLAGRLRSCISSQSGPVYPLLVEAAAMAQPDIIRAAFLEVKGKNVLVVESDAAERDLENLRQRINGGLVAGFVPLDEPIDRVVKHPIPVDRRHQSKVLYDKLRKGLS